MKRVLFILALLFAAQVEAATYWVRPTGTMIGCTASATAPGSDSGYKSTINAGLTCLAAGDTLNVRAGTYDEQVVLSNSIATGTAGSPIIIQGNPGDSRPIIRPGPSTGNPAWSVLFVDHANQVNRYTTIRGLEIDQILQGGDYTGGCITNFGSQMTFDNMIARNCGRDGFGFGGNNVVFKNSQILSCGRQQPLDQADTKGLGFYRAAFSSSGTTALNGTFEDNVVDGCRGGGGVIHYKTADNMIVQRNIFRNFGIYSTWGFPVGFTGLRTATGVNIGGNGVDIGNGLGVSPGPQSAKIRNNVFYNISAPDGGNGHVFWGADLAEIYNNTYYNISHYRYFLLCSTSNDNFKIRNNIFHLVAGGETNFPMGCGETFLTPTISNNVITDPLFFDVANGNFRLRNGSPAINTGVDLSASGVTVDAANVARPQGAGFDVGAFEFIETVGVQMLVLAMDFEEGSGTAPQDASGNGNHGSFGSGVTYGAVGTGAYGGRALVFDGTGSVTVADSNTLDLTSGFTISAWFYPTVQHVDYRAGIVKNYVYYMYPFNGDYCVAGVPMGGMEISALQNVVCESTALPINGGTHLSVTYDGSTLRLYKNAVLIGAQSAIGSMAATTGTLQIGASQFGENFIGRIDRVRVYNYARDDAQVLADFGAPVLVRIGGS